MARGDELDVVLNDQLITDDEWISLAKVLKRETELPSSHEERRRFINEYLRHAWGHSVRNLAREWYEPDYLPIVREVAQELKLSTKDHHSVEEIEIKIIGEVVDRYKDKIIKEKGRDAWLEIEKEIEDEIQVKIKRGEISEKLANQLRGIAPGGIVAAIIAGRLAGFALYIAVNQVFFAICRLLGVRIGVAVAGPIIGGTLSILLGPIGWGLSAAWMIYDFGNTNWGKVIPAVVIVACIRLRLQNEGE